MVGRSKGWLDDIREKGLSEGGRKRGRTKRGREERTKRRWLDAVREDIREEEERKD